MTPQKIFHTIGIEFAGKTLVHNNKNFRLKFWDTCNLFVENLSRRP
jgi:hypothetical protein